MERTYTFHAAFVFSFVFALLAFTARLMAA